MYEFDSLGFLIIEKSKCNIQQKSIILIHFQGSSSYLIKNSKTLQFKFRLISLSNFNEKHNESFNQSSFV